MEEDFIKVEGEIHIYKCKREGTIFDGYRPNWVFDPELFKTYIGFLTLQNGKMEPGDRSVCVINFLKDQENIKDLIKYNKTIWIYEGEKWVGDFKIKKT